MVVKPASVGVFAEGGLEDGAMAAGEGVCDEIEIDITIIF